MKCAVIDCSNDANEKGSMSFFAFPKEKTLLKEWVKFCQRTEPYKSRWRICMEHFKTDDIEGHLKYEMGLCSKRMLKPGAVPCINKNTQSPKDELQRQEQQRAMVEALINTANEIEEEQIPKWDVQVQSLQDQVRWLKRENYLLKQRLLHAKRKRDYMRLLEQELASANVEKKNMERRLLGIFTEGQVRKLKRGDKRQLWTDNDITQSLILYSTSAKAYKLLKDKKFPLPAIRTLQRWAQKNDLGNAVLKPMMLQLPGEARKKGNKCTYDEVQTIDV